VKLGSCLVIAAIATAAAQALAQAQSPLETRGVGDKMELVPDQFQPEDRARYPLFKQKCTKCHAMSRPIAALRTGITPVTGGRFDEDGIKKYVVKMMRKPKSGIAKEDAKELILFLRAARGIAEGKSSE
jgi:hypothetical protein